MVEYEAPDIEELRQTSTDVASLIQQGEIVYVHCRAGIQGLLWWPAPS
jgi:protein-tyrosine phosphatase